MVRAVVDWRGQIVTMADRAYLTEAMPMAVVWGRDDKVIPVRHASNAAALAPDARVEVIPNAGHFPHKDHPHRFAKIVHEFIRSTQPATYSRAASAACSRAVGPASAAPRAVTALPSPRTRRMRRCLTPWWGSSNADSVHLVAPTPSGVAALLLHAGHGRRVVDAVLGERLLDQSHARSRPASASACSVCTTTDWASMWKYRRAAGRVSAKPNPSAPSTR